MVKENEFNIFCYFYLKIDQITLKLYLHCLIEQKSRKKISSNYIILSKIWEVAIKKIHQEQVYLLVKYD